MKILVIGESCRDRFVYCNTDRLSPEAPVPVLVPNRVVESDGMAVNVVNNILSMDQSIDVKWVIPVHQTTKTRYVDEKSNHMFFRVDEPFTEDKPITHFNLTEEVESLITSADAVIVSDYDKGFLTREDLLDIASLSKFSILDTKKILDKYVVSEFNFIKLNEKEYSNNSQFLLSYKFIVTLGQRGAMYMDKIYPSPSPKETIDVSGAGDTFIAAFTINYLKSDVANKVEESIEYANKMCSIVVSKRGISTP